MLGEVRVNLEGYICIVLGCNYLVVKNYFKMFLVKIKKCNICDVIFRIMFCIIWKMLVYVIGLGLVYDIFLE